MMIVTPTLFVSYGINGTHAIWGWTAMFGGDLSLKKATGEVFKTINCDFNWEAYVTCLVLFVIGFTTYFIGPKSRGYYIFSAIVLAGCAVMLFTMCSSWMPRSINFGYSGGYTGLYLGVGPWAGGFLSCFGAIACIYEFKTAKLR